MRGSDYPSVLSMSNMESTPSSWDFRESTSQVVSVNLRARVIRESRLCERDVTESLEGKRRRKRKVSVETRMLRVIL